MTEGRIVTFTLELTSVYPPAEEYMVLIWKTEEVRAGDGLLIEPAEIENVCPPLKDDANRLEIVRVLGDIMVQVGVVETLVPVALEQVPVELASVYSAGKSTSTSPVLDSLLAVVRVKV